MNEYQILKNFYIIFSHSKYRQKLDKIILEFFGLTPKKEKEIILKNAKIPILEFNILYNNIFLFNILVKDNKKLFSSSKRFYLNFSSITKKRSFELIMPCYWNIYYKYKSPNILEEKKLIQFAKFFAIKNKTELKKFLTDLKLFNNAEINDIINMVII